jgi:hypothetical protein
MSTLGRCGATKSTNAIKESPYSLLKESQMLVHAPLTVILNVMAETFSIKVGVISTTQLEAPNATKKVYTTMIELLR